MTLEQKILSKLEPHAKRIKDGDGNDFDYLPAVLLQLMEEQKRQDNLLENTAKLLSTIQSTGDNIGVQSKAQITAFESATQKKMQEIEEAIKNTQSAMHEQIAVIASAQTAHVKQTAESLRTIGLQIESFGNNSQRAHSNFMRLLIAGLVASTAMIGLAVAILQRH